MTSRSPHKIKVIVGASAGQVIDLAEEQILIGRDEVAQILLDEPSVSRRHARLILQPEGYLIEDLGSANGTKINGRLLAGRQLLKPGDRITVGKTIVLEYDLYSTFLRSEPPDFLASTVAGLPLQPPADSSGVPATQYYDYAETFNAEQPAASPQIIISVVGQKDQAFPLSRLKITLGRESDNDIVIPSNIISRHHLILERIETGYRLSPLPGVTNATYLEGRLLTEPQPLHHNNIIRVGNPEVGAMVTLTYISPGDAALKKAPAIQLGPGVKLQIGRHPDNDIVLTEPTVSGFHAQVERVGQRYRLKDLNSSNGTFVNNQRVVDDVWIKPEDSIRIGPYRFVLGADQLAQFDESGGMQVDAVNLNKWVRKDQNILQNISLSFLAREFIVIVGQSGGGKSTLLDAISGIRPASNGAVFVNDIDVYRNFEAIRSNIGYVPQRDIIHMELTISQALDYAAKLRMPPDTTTEERQQRIDEVLTDLDLLQRKDLQISSLSGGQQKRVSIGVELLNKPGLFFLDEPTSGLDPGTETIFMQLMRSLADQGRTIILVTHATKNVMLADKVVFLARGGYLAWFGPPDEALDYFDSHRSDREKRLGKMEFDQIYNILEDPSKGGPADWAQRFQNHPAFQKNILQPLQNKGITISSPGSADPARVAVPLRRPAQQRRASPHETPVEYLRSALRQFVILSARNLKIITRDRASLILMLATAPLMSMLEFVLASGTGRNPFDVSSGNFRPVSTSFFMIIIAIVLLGSISQMREFVKESAIYKRERLVNLKILPYVLSKMWVAALLALYQAGVYTAVRFLAYDMPGGILEFFLIYLCLVLANFAGMMLGLFSSALAPNANTVPLIVISFIIPQFLISGISVPLPGALTSLTIVRWAYQGMMAVSGVTTDVAADPCWGLTEAARNSLTLEQKNDLGCKCMGVNVFNPDSCGFPGLGQYYNPAIDQPEPAAPPAIGSPPEKPALPAAPQEPANKADTSAMNQYFIALKTYQDEVARIEVEYEAQVKAYQAQVDAYQQAVAAYQEKLGEWKIARNEAIGKAEGMIQQYYNDYSWVFVNKDDAGVFWFELLKTWFAQGVIITVFFSLTLFLMKRKDKAT